MKNVEIKIEKEVVAPMANKYELRFLALFGSQAQGTADEKSDIDIAFISKRKLELNEEFELGEEIKKILNNEKIDLVDLRKADPLLLKEVYDNGKLLVEFEKDSFDNFQIYAYMTYIESKPLLKMREDYIKKTLKNYV